MDSVYEALQAYFPGRDAMAALPVRTSSAPPDTWAPRLSKVALPDWADGPVSGYLLVPEGARCGPDWRQVDWWRAAHWYLAGIAERALERRRGPIHSYSVLLRNFDPRMWERAWVNRIGLFLRSWAAHRGPLSPPPVPTAQLWLTHDVDAVRKTPAIRLKQSAFQLFNAVRSLARLRLGDALEAVAQGVLFFLRTADYWAFEAIRELERRHGFNSLFLFYGGPGGWRRSPRALLLDPDYDVREPRISTAIRALQEEGCRVGLHQAFDSWRCPDRMRRERERLQQVSRRPVVVCRQHWLRFSWEHTWRAQEEAGLLLDTTLAFNDRPGFRNGAALRFRPGDGRLQAIPTVLMDSQLYDYRTASSPVTWLDEIQAVGGEACVIWHQQVFNPDYGWEAGYRDLLQDLGRRQGLKAAPIHPDLPDSEGADPRGQTP
ncbi:MAG: hypothetical protein AB1758_03050 [Candidatus Eremiobacterota bacterium]